MIDIRVNNNIRVYNDGIFIVDGRNIEEVKSIINNLLIDNKDTWEVELLNMILYTIENNLSTMEVA